MRVLLLIAALILASCVPNETQSEAPTNGSPQTAEPKPDTPEACAKKGGTYRRVCLMGTLACVMPYSDAGKPCTDKKDCQGQCRYEGGETPPPGTKVTGACQRTSDPCGCFGVVADGKLEAMLCVD